MRTIGGMYYELTDHFIVAADLERTWEFFSRAENLPRITPPWLRFEVRTPGPITIGQDTILDYGVRSMGVPLRWRSKIIDWSPPRQFIDLQVKGPYAQWVHQHRFDASPQGAECRDRVVYSLPASVVGRVVHVAVVRRQLLEIFRFRRKVIGEQLGWVRAVQEDVQIRRL
jgi:ligand-binding SRPBCC domain-containing protein